MVWNAPIAEYERRAASVYPAGLYARVITSPIPDEIIVEIVMDA